MTNLPFLLWLLLLWYRAVFVHFVFFLLFLPLPLLLSIFLRSAVFLFHFYTLLGWLEVDSCVRCPVRIIAGVIAATDHKLNTQLHHILLWFELHLEHVYICQSGDISNMSDVPYIPYLELLWSSGQGSFSSSSFSSSEECPLICRTSTSP